MPVVHIHITEGATREQKAKLIAEITHSLATVLGKRPEHTHVLIHELPEPDWGYCGLPTDEWKTHTPQAGNLPTS
ncbi:MAG TPA: 4-oxalocrotonate tautomerase family protein [Limnobacter sp.]|nr:4-oxalocrotonate tautomerase family protein [Limnobacter sp.]